MGVPSIASKRYIVMGRVQGVGFRTFVKKIAAREGLSGFVRNDASGSVEVVAVGKGEAIERLEGWLRAGSALAEVEDLTIHEWGSPLETDGFQIRE